MNTLCTNPNCSSCNIAQESHHCSNCFFPTRATHHPGEPALPVVDGMSVHYDLQWHPISRPTEQATGMTKNLIAPQAIKPLPGFTQPVETYRIPFAVMIFRRHQYTILCRLIMLQGSGPWPTPPSSSKSLTPAGEMSSTRGLGPQRPGSSWRNQFTFYNPGLKSKSNERSRRSCMSCYNRNDRKVHDPHEQL